MSLFRNQPGYCSVCGDPGEYPVKKNAPLVCGDSCRKELERRYTLYVMGREYYPREQKEEQEQRPGERIQEGGASQHEERQPDGS